ncbi:MAG: D-alanyl-D-alanine carboxypeptidase, partial [Clostridia bacterium]|nr:D-alanyl-D-alanine carboxypeptidase [Clostridia bacterium]
DDEDTNITSAHDIAVMSSELIKHELIQNYSTIWMDSLRDGATELVNTNKLVRFYPGTTGLKTGTTSKAGCCLSATAQRDGLHLCAVVLGSDNSTDRFESAKALLNYGFSSYVSVSPSVDKSLIAPVKVVMGEKEKIVPEVPEIKPLTVKKGDEKELKQTITLDLSATAPVEKGQTLGKIVFSVGDEVLSEYLLLSPENVEKITLPFAFKKLLGKIA